MTKAQTADLAPIRKKRLGLILGEMTARELAQRSGLKVSTIGMLRAPSSGFGDGTARRIEKGAKKPEGWLDRPFEGMADLLVPGEPAADEGPDNLEAPAGAPTEPDPEPKSEPQTAVANGAESQTQFVIEKGVPRNRRPPDKYPFANMVVDDAFFVRLDGATPHQVRDRIRKAWNKWRRQTGNSSWMFSTGAAEKEGVEGVYCWRDE